MATRDWIKKDYIITEVPGPLILDAANIVYPYESPDVFRDESLYTVPIQRQASINNRCRQFALAVAFPFPLRLPFRAITAS